MTVAIFVDANVLVYSRDASELKKQSQALDWVDHIWRTRRTRGRLSFQVLGEYYTTVTRKLRPGLSPQEARADVLDLMAWRPLPIDPEVLEGAWALEDRFALAFWDALIVSAAKTAGCEYLLTEDLQHGQTFDEIQVANPFHTPVGSLD